MRFGDFSWICLGYKSLCLAEVNLSPQTKDGVPNTGNALVVFGLLSTSRYRTYKQYSKGLTHVSEVELFSGVNSRTGRHCIIPELPEVYIAATKPSSYLIKTKYDMRWVLDVLLVLRVVVLTYYMIGYNHAQ